MTTPNNIDYSTHEHTYFEKATYGTLAVTAKRSRGGEGSANKGSKNMVWQYAQKQGAFFDELQQKPFCWGWTSIYIS